MELWIRSQDKSILTRVNEININYKEPTKIICNHYLYGEQHENYIFLGEYETKERALEVLDEIQKEIINSNYYDFDDDGYINNISHNDIVYEMPED